MQAMFKSELAKLAGVSSRTFRRYLATRRHILTAMGVSPFARKLPPQAVHYISEDYCIDIPPCAIIKNIIKRLFLSGASGLKGTTPLANVVTLYPVSEPHGTMVLMLHRDYLNESLRLSERTIEIIPLGV